MARSLAAAVALSAALASCSKEPPKAEREIVVYCALDDVFAKPLLEEYGRETGVTVKPAWDQETAKSTVLATKLREEKERPQADVWWNNEPVLACLLKEEGILAAYESPSAQDVPAAFHDADRRFVSFAARARVIVANTQLVSEVETPESIFDLAKPRWKGKVGIAKPLFGTTLTHSACLFEALGEEKAKQWFLALKANDVRILASNSMVRDQVASGELEVGLTDTDDANGAVVDGKPVRVVWPDEDGIGTLVMPNTISLVAGAPHAEEGRRLIDWLLRTEVESRLAAGRSAQMPVRPSARVPAGFRGLSALRPMQVDFGKAAGRLPAVLAFIEGEFLH